MSTIHETCAPVNARATLEAAVDQALHTMRQAIGARLSTLLTELTSHAVGREHHVRRRHVAQRLRRGAKCCRCGSTRSRRFSRNGYRARQPLLTMWGEVPLELPRVRCECGGSVQVDFGDLLHPHQQMGADVDAVIQRYGGMALSLRQMRQELAHTYVGPVALRTLSQRLHQLASLDPHRQAQDVPPILQVDALWITLLRSNGQVRRDRKGRLRAAKGRFKVPVFVAMGVWPDQDRCEILLWRQGESENADEWVKFLEVLEAQGVCGRNGLKLIIHDGSAGLGSALQTVWLDAQQQRCLFHKLRNISQAIRLPEDLSGPERKRERRRIMKEFVHIWQAQRYETVLHRYLKVVRTYRHVQPEAVATLRRDFRLTATYYGLERQFPEWARRHLRTTSRLERFNRTLRRRTRAANAYHSDIGLAAMMAQETRAFHTTRPAP